jgi:nucleoside-diphosphate-sugar epimerase
MVTGSQGYIGTELIRTLKNQSYEVACIDAGFYQEDAIKRIAAEENVQVDIRNLDLIDFDSVKCIIHLAAISNDPLGQLNQSVTFEINNEAAVNLAKRAMSEGIEKFIFVSSQSIYGVSKSNELLSEEADKSPVTAYAKSKWLAEQQLLSMNSPDFTVVAVRPATVFGWGNRIRNDIIFNNMIASGLKKGIIEVHSDGTPIRPVLHILDLIDFLILLIESDKVAIQGEAFNIGLYDINYSVLEVARIASECLNDIPIRMETENLKDERSYRVSFLKAWQKLDFKSERDLYSGAEEILLEFKRLTDNEKERYFNRAVRIDSLRRLIESEEIDLNLIRKVNG